MGKGLFTTFRSRVAEAEQRGTGVLWCEMYLFFLLPGGVLYYGERLHYYITSYMEARGEPWYYIFADPLLSVLFIFPLLALLCLLWQFLTLQRFSRRFFPALWCGLILYLASRLVYYYLLDDPEFISTSWRAVPYGLSIYYFYKRKLLFTQEKPSETGNNRPPSVDCD